MDGAMASTFLTIDQQYTMGNPVGLAIIVNNQIFDEGTGCSDRDGSQVDLENLVETFTGIGFQISVHENLTRDGLYACFAHYSQCDLGQFSSVFVIVLSHGKRGHVYGVDGHCVPIINLTSKFRSTSCPSMAGKPKGFVMVACQSDESGCVSQLDLIPVEEEDFIVGYSTTPGYPSYRTFYGTPYIQCLTRSIQKYAGIRPMSQIFVNANKHVYRAVHQSSLMFSTLQKLWIFDSFQEGRPKIQ